MVWAFVVEAALADEALIVSEFVVGAASAVLEFMVESDCGSRRCM